MFSFRFSSFLSRSHFHLKPPESIFYGFNSFSAIATEHSTPHNPVVCNFLIENLKFPKSRALKVFRQCSHIKSTEKPQAVVDFFRKVGFSDAQIQSSVNRLPQLLCSDVEETFKPKIEFLQRLGLSGPNLVKLISRNPDILMSSLDRKVKPCIEIIKKFLKNNQHKDKSMNDGIEDFVMVLPSYHGVATADEQTLRANISYLESIGIVGSSLSSLLKRKSRLFNMRESKLRDLVSRAVDMGFAMDSGMLVHGIQCLGSISAEAFCRKKELFQGYGFSEIEFRQMVRKTPTILGLSDASLRFRIDFYLDTVKLNRSALMDSPFMLTYSMEKRVIPRYRVLEAIELKGLLEKKPPLRSVLKLSDAKFLESYVSRFTDDAEDLRAAYGGKYPHSSGNPSTMKI